MTEIKPKKTEYTNQKEIFEIVLKEIKKKYLKLFSRAYVMGSLVSGKFGIYEKEYEGYLGSDIDIIGIPKDCLPKNWKYKGICHDWHHAYQIGVIEIKGIKHPINLIIPIKHDLKLLFDKTKELKKEIIRIK